MWGFDGEGTYAEATVTSLPVNMWVETLCLQALLGASVVRFIFIKLYVNKLFCEVH